jgi:hypothetical protein
MMSNWEEPGRRIGRRIGGRLRRGRGVRAGV